MSLRARLLLALAAVALVALVVADFATYTQLRRFLYGQVDSSLDSSHAAIQAALGAGRPGPGGGSRPPGPGAPNGDDTRTGPSFCFATANGLAPGAFVAVRTASGAIVDDDDCPAIEAGGREYSPTLPSRIPRPPVSGPGKVATAYFTARSTKVGGPAFRVGVSELMGGRLDGDELVLASPLTSTHSTLERLLEIELAVTSAALGSAVLLGWWLVRLGLRPLRRVELTAATIAGGDVVHRIPGADERTEVGRVALALNFMLERIEQAFAQRDVTEAQLRESEDRLRRFVADASHELRTPVAAVSAYSELLERFATLPPEDVTRMMKGIRTETTRMANLVGDLLLLARLDEGRPLVKEDIELVDLVGSAIETARMVGPQWPVTLEATDAVEVSGDSVRLRQVFDNLLGNVRSHTPPGTTTSVRIARHGDAAIVEVADEGPGLSQEQARRVFERFYRADPSGTCSHSGAGLGLSIVSSIVSAHAGTVTARPGEPRGAVFTVRLPASPAARGAPGTGPPPAAHDLAAGGGESR